MRKVIKNFNLRAFINIFVLLAVLAIVCWFLAFAAEEGDAVGIQYTMAKIIFAAFEFPFFWLVYFVEAFQNPLFYFSALTADLFCYALLIERIITFFRLKKGRKARSVEAGIS